jgi:hypothetical protein
MKAALVFSCAVPVLPAAGRPMPLSDAVPSVSTPRRTSVTLSATSGEITCSA